jgi:hypothetical protein
MSEHQLHRPDAAQLVAWRARRLTAVGFSEHDARELASTRGVDLHLLLELIDRGCSPQLAARITAPLETER